MCLRILLSNLRCLTIPLKTMVCCEGFVIGLVVGSYWGRERFGGVRRRTRSCNKIRSEYKWIIALTFPYLLGNHQKGFSHWVYGMFRVYNTDFPFLTYWSKAGYSVLGFFTVCPSSTANAIKLKWHKEHTKPEPTLSLTDAGNLWGQCFPDALLEPAGWKQMAVPW